MAREGVADSPWLRLRSANFPGDDKFFCGLAIDDVFLADNGRIRRQIARSPSQLVCDPAGRMVNVDVTKIVVNGIRELVCGLIEAPKLEGVKFVGRVVVPAEGEPGAIEFRRENDTRGNGPVGSGEFAGAIPMTDEEGERLKLGLQCAGRGGGWRLRNGTRNNEKQHGKRHEQRNESGAGDAM